jgi:hypothetical protein
VKDARKNKKVYLSLYPKRLSSIASVSTPIGRAGRAPDEISFSRIIKEVKEGLFIDVTPIGREFILVKSLTTQRFSVLEQSNNAKMIARYDSRVASSRQNSNAMIETDHEGKTLGSVLCGLVYAPRCALLVTFCVYNAKKILVDALGTLRTTGTLSL